jgi:protein Tex
MLELQIPNYEEIISNALELKIFQVKVVLDLVKEGSTVPFIARYRKEATGNLDENDIRNIIELQKKEENLYNAKVTAIN